MVNIKQKIQHDQRFFILFLNSGAFQFVINPGLYYFHHYVQNTFIEIYLLRNTVAT